MSSLIADKYMMTASSNEKTPFKTGTRDGTGRRMFTHDGRLQENTNPSNSADKSKANATSSFVMTGSSNEKTWAKTGTRDEYGQRMFTYDGKLREHAQRSEWEDGPRPIEDSALMARFTRTTRR
ncbi:hypothetical protein NUW58_g5445 [Xylaria curta]|uniref:Uncharacterized protein n=1 Tax=Xylaria curta TaxID=42375 RepID=A0ACC1P315_9PEZI|nr:hypothetical protein NUW58_g5445 [Xylaria curta]